MSFAPGEIVLATFPFSDLTGVKRRPCVVLAVADMPNEFVVAFITSKAARESLNSAVSVAPDHPQWRQTGLKTASVIRADKLATLHTRVISGGLGSLPADLRAVLKSKLMSLFQLT